jgi:serine/threonine protein kinase
MLLDDGRVKLADFGISSIRDDPSLTASGEVIGSPAFMSPEQAQGEPASARTDLWGLGATLYYAVEGAPPFGEGEAIPTLRAVVHDAPRPMRRAGSLARVVSALLEKDPAARPAEEDLPRLFDEATARATLTADDSRTAPILIPAIDGAPSATDVLPEEPSGRRSWIVPGAIAAAIAVAALIGIVAFGGSDSTPAKSGKGAAATDGSVARKDAGHTTSASAPAPAQTTPSPAPTTETPPPADHGDSGGPNGVANGHDGGPPGNQHGEGDEGNGNGQGAQAIAPAPPEDSPEPSVSPSPTKAGNPIS